MAATVHKGEVYSIAGYLEGAGRWGRTTDVWSNDGSTDPWTTRPSLSYERASAGAASLGDYVYVVGGHHEDTGHGFSLSLVERYNPTAGGGWQQMGSLNQDRQGLGVAEVGGKIYAIGGLTYEIHVRFQIGGWLEVYNPGTNTWTYGPSMPTPRTQVATAVVGSRIYVIGGVESGGVYSDLVEYFDVDDQTWHSDRSLPVSVAGPRAAAIGNTLYVSGGMTSSSVYLDTVYSASVSTAPPVADADGPYTIDVDDPLILNASGSTDVDDDIDSYLWDLNDDGLYETDAGGNMFFVVSYTDVMSLGLTAGDSYDIHLKVTDATGLFDTADSQLTILPEPATLGMLVVGGLVLVRRRRRGVCK